jgi:murein DD-endopeptidase MepM/ murein hydrolase activator NlpD
MLCTVQPSPSQDRLERLLSPCVGALWLVCAIAQASAADTAAPTLDLPLTCTVGRDCWVANYVDVDRTRGAGDFRCGPRSYDGHDGLDFAIRDRAAMAQGVNVVAAASGTVKSVRDGMPDTGLFDARAQIRGRECGNGVVIDHGGGWQTQYCHLHERSVRVKAGDRIAAGTPLGQVGLSGETEFAHLHFALRYRDRIIDPFSGQGMQDGCGQTGRALWRTDLQLDYETVALYNAGFAAGKPDPEAIRSGERSDGPFPLDAPVLVLWADLLGVQAGDSLRFRVSDSRGALLFEHQQRIEKNQARRFVYAGMRRGTQAWNAGTYTGEVMHTRMVDGRSSEKKIVTTVAVH